ncbi:MAG: GtrA family protein [Chitinophagaceae bacterium]|nr:MAG: GtrA family protein [Chitinophagaceae bacterium]
MKSAISGFIELFYPPFKRIMPLQTFKYAACGGANALLGLVTFYLGYRFVFAEKVVDFGFIAFEPHSAALIVSSIITFTIGFILNRYVVFTTSNLRGRIQVFRYFLSFTSNLIINYFLLKFLVEKVHLHAMVSQVLTTGLVIAISYFTQRHFTFRVTSKGTAEFTDLQ